MAIRYVALPTDSVEHIRAGKADANGLPAERTVSDGDGNPCRHCLCEIPKGREMLVLAYRPFSSLQPYAEVGPIFLCADSCKRYSDLSGPPGLYIDQNMLIRGYSQKERIVYGTGHVVSPEQREYEALALLSQPGVEFVHVRSPTNNCYHFRMEIDDPR